MQGQYEDSETGLYYNRYRYFDPNICAYISQDPLGLLAGSNTYCYPFNPLRYTDPLGLRCPDLGTGDEPEVTEKKKSNIISENINKKIPNDEILPPETRGNAPISKKDGKPIEIHHDEQMPNGPFEEMHPSDHRYGDNYKKNHPNYNKKSKIDRKQFNKDKKDYWKEEWDSGRFKK